MINVIMARLLMGMKRKTRMLPWTLSSYGGRASLRDSPGQTYGGGTASCQCSLWGRETARVLERCVLARLLPPCFEMNAGKASATRIADARAAMLPRTARRSRRNRNNPARGGPLAAGGGRVGGVEAAVGGLLTHLPPSSRSNSKQADRLGQFSLVAQEAAPRQAAEDEGVYRRRPCGKFLRRP